jgi:hypothetical protein
MGCCGSVKILEKNYYYPSYRTKFNYNSYIYNFYDPNLYLVKPKSSIEISSFGLYGLKQAYEYIKIHYEDFKNLYVLCPVYWHNSYMKDTQLAVTGKCLNTETFGQGAQREVAEELGIFIPEPSLNLISSKQCDNESIIYNYISNINITNINNCRPFSPNIDRFNIGYDNKYKKIQIVVFGNFHDIKNILEKIKYRHYSNDGVKIKSIRIISLKEF